MAFTDSPQFSPLGLPISHYFDALYLSYELQVCKPDLAIFRKVLELGAMRAEETLFVDDSLENISAAQQLGIHGLCVASNSDWEQPLHQLLDHLNSDAPAN